MVGCRGPGRVASIRNSHGYIVKVPLSPLLIPVAAGSLHKLGTPDPGAS